MTRGAVVLLAALAAAAPLPAAPTPTPDATVMRVFRMKYRRAEDAALLVRPLLTDSGQVVLQPKPNVLTVRDTGAAVERVAAAIRAYDLAPRAVTLSVTLLRASPEGRADGAPPEAAEDIRGVGRRLRELFNFKSFTRLDSVLVQGVEGDDVAYVVGGSYRLEFRVDPTGDDPVVRMKGLALDRIRHDNFGRESRHPILRTSINVPVRQPYVLGVGRDEPATGALFLVFEAEFGVVGPGVSAGVR